MRPLPLLWLLLFWPTASLADPALRPVPVFRQVAGEIRTLTVRRGDMLLSLAARAGVGWKSLAAQNRLDDPDRIYPGQALRADTRRVVPAVVDEGWVVNVPEATLYVFEAEALVDRYVVGLGRDRLPTPLGSFTVLQKLAEPGAPAAETIRAEMEDERRVLREKSPPGPDSVLARRWIQLSVWGYGLYGTRFRASVGRHLGYGCIRVDEERFGALFDRARAGTRVEVVYLPVKVAVTPEGEVWVEAHPDVYGLGFPEPDRVFEALDGAGVLGRVDREQVVEVLARQDGVARKVGAPPPVVAPGPAGPPDPDGGFATWRCLDCPPGAERRVTFRIEARQPLELPNPYPIEIRDDAGRVVFRPQMVAQALVRLEPGESRNFVWEVRDTAGQPLPPGSYTAVVRFVPVGEGPPRTLELPLWVGK